MITRGFLVLVILSTLQSTKPLIFTVYLEHCQGFVKQYLPSPDHQNFHVNSSKNKELSLQEHKLIHDEPTRWNSSYDMVERFLEQWQAVCAVLAEDRKKWHLMPKDSDITILETLKEVLGPLSPFTDALSGEH